MLDNTIMQIFPSRFSLRNRFLDVSINPHHATRSKNLRLAERVAVERFDSWPSHQFWRREAFDEVAAIIGGLGSAGVIDEELTWRRRSVEVREGMR